MENKEQNICKYLSGELDEQSIEKMENEFLGDKEKEEQMKDFTRIWKKSSEIAEFDKINVETDWQKVKGRMGFDSKSKKIPLHKYVLRISAILILAFGLAYILNQVVNVASKGGNNNLGADYFELAAKDAKRKVTLPDASQLVLNKGAKVIYNRNYGLSNREVILEGEAFFEVARNEKLPFKVYAEGSTIEVLGTSFNIKPTGQQLTVSVVSGKVAFYETDKKTKRVELEKDEQVVYDSKKQEFHGKKELNANIMTWRTGRMAFKMEPLGSIFKTMEAYYNCKIINQSEFDLEKGWSGDIQTNDEVPVLLNQILNAFENGRNCTIIKEKNTYYIRNKS